MDEDRKMPEILAKLFSRGNRTSDRLYADRARPTRIIRQLERERRDEASARTESNKKK